MAASKAKTPSFVATIRLKASTKEEKQLLVLSECARQLYNACLGECLKRLTKIQKTSLYKKTTCLYKITKEKKEIRKMNFKLLNKSFGFTDYSLQSFGIKTKNESKFIAEHLGTHVCQKIATRAFQTAQKYAFKQAKKVRFKSKGEFVSFEGKNNSTFLTYSHGYVLIGKNLTLKCLIPPKDKWMQHALKQRIKYCRIIKKEVKGKNRFYIQLILEGFPLRKYDLGKEEVGLDIGPSTIAIVGETKAELKEFCEEIVPLDREKRRLLRKLDRQRRANNPSHYQENGVVKKGKKKWVYSKKYIKTRAEIREMERKIRERRRQVHGRDTNQILQLASSILSEKLSYKAFQKMYGKSIGRKGPSLFIKILKRKIETQGGTFREFPTNKTKLSQTCHCGAIKKKPLRERWHKCACGVVAQRDLYSAYLARFISVSNVVDLVHAKREWEEMSVVLERCISSLETRTSERKLISTFGV